MIANRRSCHARIIAGVFILTWLSGCVAQQTARLLEAPPASLPVRTELDNVPYYPQQAHQCGPATLAMVLGWSGLHSTPEQLEPEVYIPGKQGSLQPEMIAAARRHGRLAYLLQPSLDDLLAEVAAGHPVIVLQNLALSWYPVWHYAVVIGYDLDQRVVILHSGADEFRQTPISTFEYTWARSGYWGLLILPPGKLPRTADKERYLESVLTLEQTGQLQAAAAAYRTALGRWPQSEAARIGLGNSYYAMGKLAEAETAFRQASRDHPQSGIAFNNLAQTCADEGKLEEALAAARRAVKLGGPLAGTFRQTLAAIQAKMTKRAGR